MGLSENGEPDIEPEIALLTRETTTDLASTSTVGLPKSNVDLATIPGSSTVTLPDSRDHPVLSSERSPQQLSHSSTPDWRYPVHQHKPPDRLTYG